ncbi:hypothetical protein [Conchiformibius steedae]|uniref:Uncharacterized protein n=1 Tax=Conchiformibius steedae TaxID=153493 RepID=A0A3P2A784_9NEIS|nr:hypothetical protein [Conchiformibius steedae]RRD91234.1 hypothetical protein EII21_02255 [Conchiformibius steedae]
MNDYDEDGGSEFKSVLLWTVFFLLLGAAGYGGWYVVSGLGQSAENIQSQVEQAKPRSDVNTFTLSQVSGAVPAEWQQVSESVSSGTDLAVQKGEFAYRDGRPVVRVAVYNQGGFAISAAQINLSLLLDGSNEPFAQVQAVPVPLSGVLLPGDSVIADIPVDDPAWRDEAVRLAGQRRVLAQVVFVNDADRDNIDYPQTDAGVYLKQVENDWGAQYAEESLPSESEAEASSAEFDETAGVEDVPAVLPQQ